jgi:AcrR family transcriptional regulator
LRRRRLIEAAADLFAGGAYGQVSMDRIAAAGGVGKPTLYRYFATKDQLFNVVVTEALDRLGGELAGIAAAEPQPARRLIALIAGVARTLSRHFGALGGLGDDALLADHARRQAYQQHRARLSDPIRATIAAGIADGVFAPVDPALIAMAVLGSLRAAAIAGVARDPVAVAALTRFILTGLGHAGEPTAAGDPAP